MVADERSNSVLIGGEQSQRLRVRALIAQLDTPLRVRRRHPGALPALRRRREDRPEAQGADDRQLAQAVARPAAPTPARGATNPQAEAEKNAMVWADPQNNALVITAPPKVMRTVMDIVDKLDIRRPQVLVQAIIAEVDVDKDAELGVNWAAFSQGDKVPLGGFVSPVGGTSIVDLVAARRRTAPALSDHAAAGHDDRRRHASPPDGESTSRPCCAPSAGDTDTNIIATPSAVTMDNQEATLKVVARGAVRHRPVHRPPPPDHRRRSTPSRPSSARRSAPSSR